MGTRKVSTHMFTFNPVSVTNRRVKPLLIARVHRIKGRLGVSTQSGYLVIRFSDKIKNEMSANLMGEITASDLGPQTVCFSN